MDPLAFETLAVEIIGCLDICFSHSKLLPTAAATANPTMLTPSSTFAHPHTDKGENTDAHRHLPTFSRGVRLAHLKHCVKGVASKASVKEQRE